MSIFEAVALSIGEATALVIGHVVGKTFNLDSKKAQRLGENVVLGALLGAVVLLTVIYS